MVVNGLILHCCGLQVASQSNTYCWTVKMRSSTRVTPTTRRLLEKVIYTSAQRCTMKQTTKWNNYYNHCHWLIKREGNLGGSLKHIYFLTMVLGVIFNLIYLLLTAVIGLIMNQKSKKRNFIGFLSLKLYSKTIWSKANVLMSTRSFRYCLVFAVVPWYIVDIYFTL